MFRKKECVAMLLAGGQGSRLYALTSRVAKPAVQFGGKHRIIDFPLSNCINSGIDTVGVLTQYQPLVLNEYIGNGLPWDLDRYYGGASILPPYQGKERSDWYKGTANAIYQNLEFIDKFNPDYVLILSGDHIYKMDYSEILEYHKENGAACTIAVIDVPLEEASRFGIMSVNPDGSIYKFTEKPKEPDSTKASMGIYIFTKEKLFDYLTMDNKNPDSCNDFGKNIIPAMLSAGEKMMAYEFSGYWKDVGTISSLWEANMDLLGTHASFNLSDEGWRIYSRTESRPPHFLGDGANVYNSLMTEGCEIYGEVRNSVLGGGVKVGCGAKVIDSVIMSDVEIGDDAVIEYCIIDSGTKVGKGAKIGKSREIASGVTVIGEKCIVPDGYVIGDGEMISEI